MSISSSLSNAVAGLQAASRSAEVVSANVANAMTDGYGRREIELSSSSTGGHSVNVIAIDRVVHQYAITNRRLSEAQADYNQTRAEFHSNIQMTIGTPDIKGSLSDRMAEFESKLITAVGKPENPTVLKGVVESAEALSNKFNQISDAMKTAREQTDQNIAVQIEDLNAALEQVAGLNTEIQRYGAADDVLAGLMDQRQIIVDQISQFIPVTEVPRENGTIALVTPNGTTLVDYKAAQFAFTPTAPITADMTLASGALSEITLTGTSSRSGTVADVIRGGSLSAALELRDVDIPAAQAKIDALARDVIERAASDPTLSAGQPGLFTDHGGPLDIADEPGLAGRITINPNVTGDNAWRIRDGIGAATPGPTGNTSILSTLSNSFGDIKALSSGGFARAGSSSSLIADFVSHIGLEQQIAERQQSFAANSATALKQLELREGVDTDQEMQKLLLIEQAYAANAKVIQAVDDMLQSLMRI